MIVVTGAAGFIGSCMVGKLNAERVRDILVVDDFNNELKNKNLEGKEYEMKIHRDFFIEWLEQHWQDVDFIIHLGARTDTTEFDKNIFDRLNLNYSKDVWRHCTKYNIPLIYASSAATYGAGENGYNDNQLNIPNLHPLNPYGVSKQEFDKWVLQQDIYPPFWTGLKFFNVYGPNEYHKERMASVVYHAFGQIEDCEEVKLFRSHKDEYEDGRQLRDFIYVKDVVEVIWWMIESRPASGIYNLGTGRADSFLNLAKYTFEAAGKEMKVHFVDIPEDIRENYQYFTEAKMDKLKKAEYPKGFTSLEEGVKDYVKNYLSQKKYF